MPLTLQPGEQRELDVQLTPIPVEKARLFGRVTDASMPGVGIPGASIGLSGAGGTYQATTNDDGDYDIPNIEPGVYDGIVSHPDYETLPF